MNRLNNSKIKQFVSIVNDLINMKFPYTSFPFFTIKLCTRFRQTRER